MTISSRTLGGIPHRCPVCGHEEDMEVSVNAGDSCCPTCGQLMWMAEHNIVSERIQEQKLKSPSVPVADQHAQILRNRMRRRRS